MYDAERPEHVEHKLDGNAAAGILGELFCFEATTARVVCAYCGATGNVGGQSAYMTGMGVVVRCAGCDGPLIRLAGTLGGYWLDMRGVRVLRVESP